jgi:hypothetical protein
MNFGNDPWILHLNLPPDGHFKRASVYVALTRYTTWDNVYLLAPLWSTPAEEKRVKDAFYKAAVFDSASDAATLKEWLRLRDLSKQTE